MVNIVIVIQLILLLCVYMSYSATLAVNEYSSSDCSGSVEETFTVEDGKCHFSEEYECLNNGEFRYRHFPNDGCSGESEFEKSSTDYCLVLSDGSCDLSGCVSWSSDDGGETASSDYGENDESGDDNNDGSDGPDDAYLFLFAVPLLCCFIIYVLPCLILLLIAILTVITFVGIAMLACMGPIICAILAALGCGGTAAAGTAVVETAIDRTSWNTSNQTDAILPPKMESASKMESSSLLGEDLSSSSINNNEANDLPPPILDNNFMF